MSDKKKKIVKTADDLSKTRLLGWGMAKKAAEALTDRKKKTDLAIKKAGG